MATRRTAAPPKNLEVAQIEPVLRGLGLVPMGPGSGDGYRITAIRSFNSTTGNADIVGYSVAFRIPMIEMIRERVTPYERRKADAERLIAAFAKAGLSARLARNECDVEVFPRGVAI
jgi:hypothetical protein